MKDEVAFAAIAGLLHDIGKFALRGGGGTGDHAAASEAFARAFVPQAWLADLSGVRGHHQPQTVQQHRVQLADELSCAEVAADENRALPMLRSIFGSGLQGYTSPQTVPLAHLNPTDAESLFPQPPVADASAVSKAYIALWQAFEEACRKRLPAVSDTPARFAEALYLLLLEYTWCVPAAAGAADVSLYDHARTTAALAACFAADDRPAEWCKAAPKSGEKICLLVGGDLSGLQKFIYNITSGGAAKSLRARSFYIQLLEDALSSALLRAFDLPGVNLLYAGGGGFQALLPIAAETQLSDLAARWNEIMLTLFQGGLGVTLSWEPLTGADFADFGAARDRLGKQMQVAKRRPFAQASDEALFAAVGQAFNRGGDPLAFCAVTGEDGENLTQDDGVYKSKFVLSLEELGRKLPTAAALVTQSVTQTPPAPAADWRESLHAFGYDVHVVKIDDLRAVSADKRVWRLQPDGGAVQGAITGYRPFAQLTPTDPDTKLPLTFDDLAKPLEGHGKFERWGVLRMDVDNLGKLFREGFAGRATLARTAGLSLQLRLFFEGWLPQLAAKQGQESWQSDDLRQKLYIQYAGGDDVFVVGSWDALPLYARRIRESFRAFTCGNPHLSISGGIALADAGFPIDQAALLAGDAEEAAKHYEHPDEPGKVKNALTFMDLPLSWELFAEAQEDAERLANDIQSGKLPRALVQTVLALYEQMHAAKREAQRQDLRSRLANPPKPGAPKKVIKPAVGRWTWMSAYQFSRIADRNCKNAEDKAYVKELREKLITFNEHAHALGLATRWAQYLIRGA